MDVPVELSDHNQRQEQHTLQNVAGGDHHKWIISINEELKQAQQDNAAHAWDEVFIYRIPHHLKDGRERAYEPQILSLGPYHHGKKHLSEMEHHKWRCLRHMLDRTKHEIGLYLDCIKKVEERARACYEGTISLTSNQFVQMMVLDGCFVIEQLRACTERHESLNYLKNDPIFSARIASVIRGDMIMLENQIPLFILDRLLGFQRSNPDLEGEVAKLVPQFFSSLRPTVKLSNNGDIPLSDLPKLHCLDVFRESLLYSDPKPTPTETRTETTPKLIRSVTELRKAGIKFKKKDTDRFWDMSFKNGTFLIPPLFIHDRTTSLFLNLIAFEQSHSGCCNEITSYVVFMDNLINSTQDVAALHHKGIIEHWLGSDTEVAELFNQLLKEVVFDIDGSYLAKLSVEVNSYCNRRWNTWRAILKHKYFSNPWSTISLVAAFVLLSFTFIQTFYSVYTYYRPSS